jgi:hypothetical protein
LLTTFNYSAAVSALPAAAPAKFALQITANMKGKDGKEVSTSVFLPKGGSAVGVADIKEAASCSIDEKTQLVCDGKPQGVATTRSSLDMAAIAPASSSAVTTGFSVDANNVVHWKSPELLSKIPAFAKAVAVPNGQYANGEAKFGLLKSDLLTAGKTTLYFQLGCPGTKEMPEMGTHGGLHDPVVEGVAKVVAL